ncbi:[FeFe] hydrogenase H-cluster radical SAM maturase HydE [Candidatus Peregrinibacteria bacterium]|nr:MAG: [FeFe] hydrogenase H-cluster radical SAM maturase HydE [Candidatus Peregrinibacteria bacterium]
MTDQEIRQLLSVRGEEQKKLFARADTVRRESIGEEVYFRGIIEFSNICEKNCFYCGIRRDNTKTERFRMTHEEVDQCLRFIDKSQYGSVVLQSGELTSRSALDFVLQILKNIRKDFPEMGITLSLGELPKEFYKELKEAGADRYLLRIETSNPELYRKLHPADHLFERRKQCLLDLKELGFQVGTGNMVGVPEQTMDDLVNDLRFFQELDTDMFGLGPYVFHEDTPLGTPEMKEWWKKKKHDILDTTLNFIAVLRLLMPTVNIATATALEAIHPRGRIYALQAGANVFMPSVTPVEYRGLYLLYQNKPCVDEKADQCSGCSVAKVKSAGLIPALGKRGDAQHFSQRNRGKT